MRTKLGWLSRRHVLGSLVFAQIISISIAAKAVHTIDVQQQNRAFSLREVTIQRGDTVTFINSDKFPHQVHVSGPDLDVDSSLQAPEERTSVAFPAAGTFEVTCGVHPRMQMSVVVK